MKITQKTILYTVLINCFAFLSASTSFGNLLFTLNPCSEALFYTQGEVLDGNIVGKVIEKGTGEALIGANVILKGSSFGDATDVEGNFIIRKVEPGVHVLIVSYLGYITEEIEVVVDDGETTEINVELEAQGFEGEEITITAQVRGQVAAINEQRSSNTITNIVSKDRIEDVPDVNAAESIGRLPGVSIQRSGGEANKVAIRGLSPKFNNVTINGVRIPSVDATDRGVDLSLISSNMLDGIEISKANTPDMDADAIGGSINLRLRTAPEKPYSDFRFQGGYTELQEEYGNYKWVGSTGKRFLQEKLGIILNINLDRYDRSADTFNGNYEIRPDPSNDGFPTPRILGLNLNENSLVRSRTGGSVVMDYKLPKGRVVGNVILTQLNNEGSRRTNSFSTSGNQHSYRLTNFDRKTSISTYSLNIDQDFEWASIEGGVSIASSDSESPDERFWQFLEEGAAPGGLLTDEVLFGDPINVPPIFFNDSSNTHLDFLSITSRKTTEDETSFFTNLKVPFQIDASAKGFFKTGFKFRSKERFNDVEALGSNQLRFGDGQNARAALALAIPELGIPTNGSDRVPLIPVIDTYRRSNFLNGDYPLGFTLQSALLQRMTQALQDGNFLFYQGQTSLGNDYSGDESYLSYFIMSELNIGDFTLIPGVRYENEETNYSAKFVPPSSVGPGQVPNFSDTSATRSGSFLLPMVHLKYSPKNWLSLRLAYTNSLSRPDFSQYAPNTYIDPFGNFVNAPNTNLRTSKSENFDASLSLYQSKLGFFTVSAFYKEIEDLIRFVRFPLLDGQTILPDLNLPNISGEPIINTFVNNENPAFVKGIEFDWQTNFWYLPSFLKGLVLNVNLTLIDSETEYPSIFVESIPIEPRPNRPPFNERVLVDTVYTGRIPDQASSIANVTIGYDYKDFSARVSFYYQNESFTGNFGSRNFEINSSTGEKIFVTGDDVFTDDLYRIDISLKQKINENIEVFSNLNNLTNEFDQNFQSDFSVNPTFIQYYGFTMDVGLRMKF